MLSAERGEVSAGSLGFWRVKVGEREEVRGCLVWAVGGCREG